jgi:hypothetical protein
MCSQQAWKTVDAHNTRCGNSKFKNGRPLKLHRHNPEVRFKILHKQNC